MATFQEVRGAVSGSAPAVRAVPADSPDVEEVPRRARQRAPGVARRGDAGQGGLGEELEWGRDAGVGVPGRRRRSLGRFGLEIQENTQELGARDAVDGAVVDLGDHADLVALQPFDDPHLPQRAVPVELAADHVGRELGQLAHPARRGQRGAAEMIVDVELGIVDPHRVAQAEGHLDQPAPEHRCQRDPLVDELAQPAEGVAPGHGGRVENGDQRHVHVEGGCLRVEEGGVEPAQPFWHAS